MTTETAPPPTALTVGEIRILVAFGRALDDGVPGLWLTRQLGPQGGNR